MSYVRTKTIKGHDYLYEVESVRVGDRVVQKHLRYVGAVQPAYRKLGTTTRVKLRKKLGTTLRQRVGRFFGRLRRKK